MSTERTLIKDLSVFQPKPLSLAISALVAAPAATAMAQDQNEAGGDYLLEEVTVTARKRTENLQSIPQSIQAISAQTIEQAGLRGMEDYVRFIPSLNIVQANPGTAKVVFRGIADAQNSFIAEPSAAVYLDEQSLVVTGQPNPRMVDIERIEALSGPQGTLYGASAQSGVLRIVTNKPDPTAFDAFVDLDLSSTKSGDMSYDASGMVNIPLSESWALRLVGFSAKDGGFIDIVEGTTPKYGVFTNDDVLQKNFNDVKYTGGRIAARWFINDDWTMDAGIIYQKTKSDGRPEHDPVYAGELNLVRFFPQNEIDRQDWTQYALTFAGDMGFADFVSATSYFTRDWTYQQDTSVGYNAYFAWCYSYYPEGSPSSTPVATVSNPLVLARITTTRSVTCRTCRKTPSSHRNFVCYTRVRPSIGWRACTTKIRTKCMIPYVYRRLQPVTGLRKPAGWPSGSTATNPTLGRCLVVLHH